jgi:predicted MPP superfamily phosphohydrolase
VHNCIIPEFVERSNHLGVDLIAITGDLIYGKSGARRADRPPPVSDLRPR